MRWDIVYHPSAHLSWKKSGRNYDFADKNPAVNKPVYHRLRIVDFDESYTYSSVISQLTKGYVAGITPFPNPVNAGAKVKLSGEEKLKEITEVSLLTQIGSLLYLYKITKPEELTL